MPEKKITRLALVDDHKLFRRGLGSLIEMVGDHYEILFEADDGNDMKRKLQKYHAPDIILMDINMPGMDGFEAAEWLKKNYPKIHVLVVSMVENETSIVRMIKLGVKGYLSKDVEPKELGEALISIMDKGFYYTDFITGTVMHSLQKEKEPQVIKLIESITISDKENKFLELACSELTYHEIAEKMFLSPRTIEGYRDVLFERFGVKSRIGLILFAVKHGLVKL